MDSIKKFFDKKVKDAKFKKAGQGLSLTSSPGRQPSSSHQLPRQRNAPTHDARVAGAAALARFEQQTKKTDVDWTQYAIKAQARKELEAERKAMEQLKLTESEAEDFKPREIECDSASVLAVQGVYFYCPLLGPEIATYNEIKQQIKEFLFSQVEEDKGVSSCLIIHTCNKNKEKVNVCIETLCKYIENILSNPTEEKFRKIRISNKAYQERIEPMEGTKEFLEAAGFSVKELPFNDATEKFWVFPEEKLDDLSTLEQLRDALVSAEPLRPQLDRGTRVLLPAEAATQIDLPPEFFNMTTDELKREMQNRTKDVERTQMLMTKVMREKLEMREIRKYRFSLIRVRFPDGLILQGTFGVYEKFAEIMTFVRSRLVNDWRPFILSLSGGGKILIPLLP
ncbi:UBX domain-containing protein 6-like isoform X2 [Palaemon carinicauda]|uniref:UBX domain-containing protein 6-like isoform X2 n=1 Tax=Palaemon carinicauda TaxID=392227 RepID=UPI0035B5E97E